jgi:hypothetical protein
VITPDPNPEIYQMHVWIRQIGPMIWRRLRGHSDSTLTDLHLAARGLLDEGLLIRAGGIEERQVIGGKMGFQS